MREEMDIDVNRGSYVRSNAPAQLSGTDMQAFLGFPLMVLMTYFCPTPATFSRQKSHATWSILIVLLVVFTLVTGLCAYAWGRLPSLSRGLQILSLNHLMPLPLSLVGAGILALVVPLLILAWAFALHILAHMQQGQGSYRAQVYSVLVIATPLLLLVVAAAFLLSAVPATGAILRLPLAAFSLLLLLYSWFLHVPALMGIQQLSVGKAVICLVAILTVALLLFFIPDLFDTHHGGGGGTGERHFKRPKKQHERFCSRCGFSLSVYDQLHPTLTQSCPRCGDPLFSSRG